MAKKEKKKDDLDTETTFADMNVEGFKWYDPSKKKGGSGKVKVTRKEYRSMVKGAFAAFLPVFLCVIGALIVVFCLMYLWLT